jgi:hypothetical protein
MEKNSVAIGRFGVPYNSLSSWGKEYVDNMVSEEDSAPIEANKAIERLNLREENVKLAATNEQLRFENLELWDENQELKAELEELREQWNK